MEIHLTKHDGRLCPATTGDAVLIGQLPVDTPLRCAITRQRNYRFHRKFFKLIDMAYPHSGHVSKEAFLDDLKILVGHCDKVVRMDGSVWLRPRSISFAKMDEDSFSQFYDSCLTVLMEHVFTGSDPEDIRRVALDFA